MSLHYSTDQFTYHAKEDILVAERSDLHGATLQSRIAVKSHRTGTIVAFEVAETLRDAEGEVYAWSFSPIRYVGQNTPKTRVLIYND